MSRALHVAIAVLSGTTGGPATYGRRLVAALAALGELEVSVLTDRPDHFAGPACRVVELPMRGGLDRLRWQYLALPRALRQLRPDVYHDTKNALPWRLPCPAVVTVHDLAYHTVPGSFPLASRLFLRLATADAVRHAARVVVPSQATADDLARFHPGTRGRVKVVPHGIDPFVAPTAAAAAATRQRLGLPANYVLHVGTVQQRKHVDLVVQAVRRLRAEGLPHRAVVVGRRGWLADAAIREIRADDTAIWLEHVTGEDLPAVYAGAAAFASPSAYEGFGFAVADALAAGVPTAIADISSLPELCGDAAVRIPTLSAAAVTEALRGILGDPARAQRLAELGRARAARFRWMDCARGHAAVYHAATGAPAP